MIRRRLILRLGDERAHDVVPDDVDGEQPHDGDDNDRDADLADEAAPIPGDPGRDRERDQREDGQEPRERLEDPEAVLGRVELVRAENLDAPDVLRKVVRHLLAKADPVGGLEHDRLEVERDDAARCRDGAFVALEDRDEGAVGLRDAQLPQPLQLGLLERTIDEAIGRFAQAGGGRPREPLVVGGQLLLQFGLDVDRLEQLVDGTRRDGLADGVVLDQLRAGIGEDRSVECDAVDPDRERGQEQEQAREHEHDEGRDRASTRPLLSCGFGRPAHRREPTQTRRTTPRSPGRRPRAASGPPARRRRGRSCRRS